jgi:Kef-type K+ transport system membrane component KefB
MGDIFASFLSVSNNFLSTVPQNEFLLIEIGMIIILCAILASFSRLIKQPPLFAYVLAGFLIGPALFGFVKDVGIISSLSEIGVAFLVFLAGLEISLKKLKQVNVAKISLVAFLQVAIVFFLTLFLVKYINLDFMQGIYVGIIISFSSTMIVLKILSDKGELITVHGRIIIAILLIQDLIAVLAITILNSDNISILSIVPSLIRIAVMVVVAVVSQKLFFNYIFKRAAASKHSKELLVLFSLAVLFVFIILSLIFKLSIAIGAFIAGVSLANLSYKTELEARIKPLRDFFSIMFFVALGMQITILGMREEIGLFIFLIVSAILIKPLVTFVLLRVFGYTQKTSFLAGFGLGQLSEFSIILAVLGFATGILTQPMLSVIIIATILSMSLTVFFLDKENSIYHVFRNPIAWLDFIPVREHFGYMDKSQKTILLVGCDRMGKIILKDLVQENKNKVLVLDFNPEIISILKEKKISCLYGDIESPDILESIDVTKLERVISTVPDLVDSLALLKTIRQENKTAKVILTAQNNEEALELYNDGADYVMLPRFSAGEIVASILKKDNASLEAIRKNQIERIRKASSLF